MSTITQPRTWQTVTLGFQGIPYPTVQPDGTLVLSADYIPLVSSSRTAEEVNGVAFRDMPAPEHLPYFLNLLDAINKKGRRVFMFLSDPGIGKSFMADVVSNIMIGEKALRYECGDKRLGDLLFTTDLTERPEQSLYERVLQKAADGKLHPLSLARLEGVLGEAYDPATGQVDWRKLVTDKTIVADVDDTFKSVAQAEGISQQSNIALREDNGLIIQAYEQDRIALADEYNKGKPGSDTALQTTLQWLAREGQPLITVQSNSGRSYELNGLDGKPGFFVILTGNSMTDGIGTFELSQSQYSRLQPSYLPNLGKLGLSHRFCQIMTGLPLTTLHKLYGSYFENNNDGFVLFCKGLRTLGLSPQEIEKIPPHQLAFLDHPMEVIEAADKCAELLLRWQLKTNLNNSNLPPNLMAELTEDYVKASTPDPRLFIMLFNRALERADRRAAKEKTVKPSFVFNPMTSEDLAATGSVSRIGSAMMELIAEEIKNKTPQQPNLRGILVSDAAELGLLPATRQGQGNVKTLAQLLNISITPAAPPNHDLMRDMIKDWGSVFGASSVAQDGDQLDPFLPVLERSFAVMKADRDHFISFIPDPSEVDLTQAQGPFELSNIRKFEFERRGADTYLVGDEENKPFEHDRLLKAGQVIGSLTIPNNEEAVWARFLVASREQKKPLQAFSLVVADDKNPESERVLILLRSEPAPATPRTQVAWRNDIRPATVIIGNGQIAPELGNKLQEISGKPNRGLITYFDASQGVDITSILDALRRDGNHKADLASQLGSILELPAMQRVTADQRNVLQRAASGITGRDSEADKIARTIKEILKGEEVKGYVAVTTPTRTGDLMKGMKNLQSTRPNGGSGANVSPNSGPGGVQ